MDNSVKLPYKGDAIKNPSHYSERGGLECKDMIKIFTSNAEGVKAYYLGNVLKYLWRYESKNGIEDLKKAKQYIDFLMEEQNETINAHIKRE